MADQRISIDTDGGALTGAELVPLVRVGSPVSAGSFSVGTAYVILSVGTTNFTAIGAASNTVGVGFVATGAGSGSGTAGPTSNIRSTTQGIANLVSTPSLDSLSDVSVPSPSNGDVLKYSTASSPPGWISGSYITPPTGAGTGLTNWQNQGGSTTVSDTTAGIAIRDVSNGAAENVRVRYKTSLPSTPYTVIGEIAVASDYVTNHHAVVGLGWSDGTKILGIGIHANSGSNNVGSIIKKNNVTTDGGTSDLNAIVAQRLFVAINDDGAALHMGIGFDGANFIRVYDQAYGGGFLTPTRICFFINPFGSAMVGTLMSYSELASNLP